MVKQKPKFNIFLISIFVILLAACSGSETYRGNWKATNSNGEKVDIVFGENDFTITENDITDIYEYAQYSFSVKNSVETYGISIDDGRAYQIHFPISGDETKGAILDANNRVLYIICRDEYLNYEDVYGL